MTKDLDFNSIHSYSNFTAKYSYNVEQNAYIPDDNSTATIKELCTTGQGFIPIGIIYDANDGVNKSFRGKFNGQNYVLDNIYIYRPGNAALFMYIYAGGTIENLTIDGHITSTDGCAVGFLYDGNRKLYKKMCK